MHNVLSVFDSSVANSLSISSSDSSPSFSSMQHCASNARPSIEILLPFAFDHAHYLALVAATLSNQHSMQTRAKNGIFKPKSYATAIIREDLDLL